MLNTYFSYCGGDPVAPAQALGRLVEAAPDNFDPDSTVFSLYADASGIVSALSNISGESATTAFVNQVLSYLDASLIDQVTANITAQTYDSEAIDELALHLMFVAAALNVSAEAEPYTADELAAELKSEDYELDPLLTAATVGRAIMTGEAGYAGIWRLIPPDMGLDLLEPFEWIDAFLFGLMIHTAWSDFPTASERDRQYILQHFFYRAIVSNIPVRAWLSASYPTGLPAGASNALLQPLLSSIEVVPVETYLETKKVLGEVIHEYISLVAREAIPTLALEKYIKTWYVGMPLENQYRLWLRETLATVHHLQTNTLTPA